MRAIAILLGLCAAGPAWAETHYITVVNGGTETIRRVQIAPAGTDGGGSNRLQSQLPPAATARISYSTGCAVDVQVFFDSGSTQTQKNVDACADPTLSFTMAGAATDSTDPAQAPSADSPAQAGPAPPPALEPWRGRSILKKLGIDGWIDDKT